MSDSRLLLYQVLIEEYNKQMLDPPIKEEEFEAERQRLEVAYQQIEDKCEREKQINSLLVDKFYQWIHDKDVKRSALCLSGGGIRSGTFGLGIMQGLARKGLLEQFDYLSTVSGGGYIGSWLTAWIHRHPNKLKGVIKELANSDPASKIDPDPAPIRYLRTYSNFITPKVGLLTADTWTFVGIYLRNLFLNWLVFIPLLISVLLIPRLVLTITLMQPEPPEGKTQIEPLIMAKDLFGLMDFHKRYIFLIIGFALGVWALAYIIFNRPSLREKLENRSRFWGKRTNQGSFLWWCLLPLIGASISLTTYWAWSREAQGETGKSIWAFLIFGISFTMLAWLIASFVLRRRPNEIDWVEVGSLLFAGIVSGLFFWALEQHPFTSPVIGYNSDFNWKTFDWWTWKTGWYVCFAVPVFLLIFLLAVTCFIGLTSASKRILDEDREWWARFSAWALIVIIGWCTFTILVIYGPFVLLEFPKIFASIGGFAGLIALVVGRSAKTPANKKEEAQGGIMSSLAGVMLPVLAFIFLALFVAALSLVTTGLIQTLAFLASWLNDHAVLSRTFIEWLTNARHYSDYINYIYPQLKPGVSVADRFKVVHLNVLHHVSTWFILGLGIFMFCIGMLLSKCINLNLFSLHAGYRNRLIRAFLGASRPNGQRQPNPFTGFDTADNIGMHELRPILLDEGDFLKPEILATDLRAAMDGKEAKALSQYLVKNELLKTSENELARYKPNDPVSIRLVAALRNDLNSALEKENLHNPNALPSSAKAAGTPNTQADVETSSNKGIQRLDSTLAGDHIHFNRRVLEQTYPDAIRPSLNETSGYKLFHVINTTLNLVGGDNLAWQQRKAEPFSITPLHSGCFRLGYRRSREYGGSETGGISIGTAAAISGAAASSNMGYYTTSPLLSLVLTLFNVRLGWWLGNPGPAGDQTYQLRAPKYSITPVLDEALGLTNDRNKYVYLTDGGHFENLALYEMVLRRCHIIVVCDGAQDQEYRFSDLGNAVRKIRIDLGVPIEFINVPIYAEVPPKLEGKGMYWALGRIGYKCIDGDDASDGLLLYIKPAVYGEEEPRDILEYRENYPAFPHQSTGDQFFDEPQFESYRSLGAHITTKLCEGIKDQPTLFSMIGAAKAQLFKNYKNLAISDFGKWLDEFHSR